MPHKPAEPETYYAHSANPAGEWQTMRDHANNVAQRAAAFAEAFGAREEALAAGYLP